MIGILSPGCYESAQSILPVRMRERVQKKIMPKLKTRAQGLGKKGYSFSQVQHSASIFFFFFDEVFAEFSLGCESG